MYTQGSSPKECQPIFGPGDSHWMDSARLMIPHHGRKGCGLEVAARHNACLKAACYERIVLSSYDNDLQLYFQDLHMLMLALSRFLHC